MAEKRRSSKAAPKKAKTLQEEEVESIVSVIQKEGELLANSIEEESQEESIIGLFNRDLLERYVNLRALKEDLEAQVSDVVAELSDVSNVLIEAFGEVGLSSVKFGKATIFLDSKYYARPKQGYTKEDVLEALRAAGLDSMLAETYNANTLSAYIRELKREKREIPSALTSVIEINPVYSVKMRGKA